MKNKKFFGIVFAVLSAVIYGCQPLFTRILGAEGISTYSIVLMRSVIASVILLMVCLAKGKVRIDRSYLPLLALAGLFGSSLTSIFLFSAFLHIPSGVASSIHYLYPAMVLVIGFALGKEKLNPLKVISLLVTTVGVSVLYGNDLTLNGKGILLAVLSALAFALYTVTVTHTRLRSIEPLQLSLGCGVVSSLILLPVTVVTDSLTLPSTVRQWVMLAALAVFVSIVALLLYKKSTEYIGAAKASIFSTFEPVTSLFVGLVFFDEAVTVKGLLGISMILTATIILCFDKHPD